MNPALYLLECYLKEFDAKVVTVTNGKFVVLDKTAFYPNSGGQPYDTGVLVRKSDDKEFKVVFVGKFGDNISHEVDEGLNEGDEVTGKIDWERRHMFMRLHTAAHILANVILKETGAKITGNQLGLEKSRIDFSLENYDKEKFKEYVEKANEVIAKKLSVTLTLVPLEEAKQILGDKFTTLAKGFSEDIKDVRIVDIKGFAKEACGGTHVKNIEEIGKIVGLKSDNKGKDRRRVYYTVE
ncbi:MAG: alanyl-tRNA editing protein [archaeon]